MKHINKFKSFLLKENKYDIDSILDKINKVGIDKLSFYEKQVLKNPEIQKKLLYQYNISLNKVKDLLNKFDIDQDDNEIYIDETFYIDGEIMIGDYDLDKFVEIINKIGSDNFIHINRFKKTLDRETDDKKSNPGYVGKFKYSDEVIESLKAYPIAINFYDERIDLVFYEKSNDEIIEMSGIEKEFGFKTKKDIDKYIKILENLLTPDIIDLVKKEIKNISA